LLSFLKEQLNRLKLVRGLDCLQHLGLILNESLGSDHNAPAIGARAGYGKFSSELIETLSDEAI